MLINCRSSLIVLLGILSLFSNWAKCVQLKPVKEGKFYKKHDPVFVLVNRVGSFNNPMETYRYYSLPYCQDHSTNEEEKLEAKKEDVQLPVWQVKRQGGLQYRQQLGESIVGDRRETSPYEITFNENMDWRLLCSKLLTKEDLIAFKEAIHNNYFFEMFVEDLPMWGYVGDGVDEDLILGELQESKTYLFSHLNFSLAYNNNRIVAAKVSTDLDRRIDITNVEEPIHAQFTYSVEWHEEPHLQWEDRMSRYADSRFFPRSFETHWLSIIYSFVLVVLLTAFLTMILQRVLKNDLSRYIELDDDIKEEKEEPGWKLIHEDVFRFPKYPAVFCAAVGTGNQLIVLTFFHLCLTLIGIIPTIRRGSLLASLIVFYCLTAFIAGFTSLRLYRQMNGKNCTRCIILTAALFPTPLIMVFMFVNAVAIVHGSTKALTFNTNLTVATLFIFVALPLTVFGGNMAKKYAGADFDAATCTNTNVAREIPSNIPWYRGRYFHALIAGILPFSAIYTEVYYIFASLWGYQIYTLIGILFLAFILLVIVASFFTVALLYFQLLREDHRWWWTTFINGGMTGLSIYMYSFYYYYYRTGMTGMLNISFYFGYMTIISFAFFLMLGSAGFQLSLQFVKYIYSQ